MVPFRETFEPEDFFKLNTSAEQLAFLLKFATLAPSSHNTQPWLFRVRDLTIELWGNEAKALPASDKDHRQFFISLGSALENILIAADYYGWPVEVKFFPDPKEKFFAARLTFRGPHYAADQVDHFPHLFFAIPHRHNNRSEYEEKPIPGEFLKKAKVLETKELKLFFIDDPESKKNLVRIASDATEEAFSDRGFKRELSRWIKPSLKRYHEGMPGYNIDIPWPISFIVPYAIGHFEVKKSQRKMVETMLKATPLFGVIGTKEDDPISWMQAGQIYERIALMATAAGLKIGALAAPIQIGNFYKELQKTLGTDLRPQMFFRLGYSNKVPKFSPRRSVKEVLLK